MLVGHTLAVDDIFYHAQRLLNQITSALDQSCCAALLSSVDGFCVAQDRVSKEESGRLAALCSSLSAVGSSLLASLRPVDHSVSQVLTSDDSDQISSGFIELHDPHGCVLLRSVVLLIHQQTIHLILLVRVSLNASTHDVKKKLLSF